MNVGCEIILIKIWAGELEDKADCSYKHPPRVIVPVSFVMHLSLLQMCYCPELNQMLDAIHSTLAYKYMSWEAPMPLDR